MKYRIPAIFIFAISLTFQACTPENDNVPEPNDNRDLYTGSWDITEKSQVFNTTSYQVSIKKSETVSNQMLLFNFYNLGFDKSAELTISGTSVQIKNQEVDGHIITGSGSLNTDKSISLSYTVNDGSGADHVTAELSR